MSDYPGVSTRAMVRASPLRAPSLVVAPTNNNEDEACPICLMSFDASHLASSVLYCGHMFHSGCIITHLRRDHRCPVCRKDGQGNVAPPSRELQMEAEADLFDSDEEDESVSFNVALNAARQSTDPRIKAQLQNLKNWTRVYRNAKKTRDALNKYLAPFDNALELHVSNYALSLWDKHREKHKEIFVNIDYTEKQLTNAGRSITRIKRQLALRHGWSGHE